MPQDSSEQGLPPQAGTVPDDTQEEVVEYTVADSPARAVQEDGPARSGSGFDPTPYLRQLRGRGGGDYLDVKWRLLWLRKEHPDAELVTEMVEHDQQMAIFKATVTLPSGGKATGYGSETASDFPDFIEKAETKAIGRALNALGFGAQFGERGDDASTHPPARVGGERAAARPTAAPPAPVPLNRAQPRNRPPARTESRPARDLPAAPAPAPAREQAPPAPEVSLLAAAPSTASADADLAEYSWNAFWPWARERGLNGPREIEAMIGQPVAGLSPAELRSLIHTAEAERRG